MQIISVCDKQIGKLNVDKFTWLECMYAFDHTIKRDVDEGVVTIDELRSCFAVVNVDVDTIEVSDESANFKVEFYK